MNMTPAEYRRTHRKELAAKAIKYYRDNREEIIARKRRKPQLSWARYTICSHKKSGYQVHFTPLSLEKLALNAITCPICDVRLAWKTSGQNEGAKFNSPSLDRKNNDRILTLNKVWIICYRCNGTKLDRSLAEFIAYCERVVNTFKGEL
jgi:5-methylcytosine-specific restriction endonuclease McrA